MADVAGNGNVGGDPSAGSGVGGGGCDTKLLGGEGGGNCGEAGCSVPADDDGVIGMLAVAGWRWIHRRLASSRFEWLFRHGTLRSSSSCLSGARARPPTCASAAGDGISVSGAR